MTSKPRPSGYAALKKLAEASAQAIEKTTKKHSVKRAFAEPARAVQASKAKSQAVDKAERAPSLTSQRREKFTESASRPGSTARSAQAAHAPKRVGRETTQALRRQKDDVQVRDVQVRHAQTGRTQAVHAQARATHEAGQAQAGHAPSKPQLPEVAERSAVRHLEVDAEHEAQRIDNYLLRELKGAPKSLIYRILRSGEVRVNGKRAKPDHKLSAGEQIRVPPLRLGERVAFVPTDDRIAWIADCILQEDRELIVLNKPSGLASHGGSGLSFGAIEAMRALKPQERLELVHRLDRDTSGLLLISKKRSALKFLQTAMLNGQITKRYLTLMRGLPKKDKFDVKAALVKNELQSGERVVKVDDDGKPSLTHFKVIERFEHCALVEATLGTGRTHQIRVHGQTVGHHLAGCDKYGDEDFNATMKALGLNRLFLHAAHIAWKSADGNRSYDAPLPADLERVLSKLRR